MSAGWMACQTNGQNMDSLRSEVFDADSDTVIVDNSANCIIWRHKKTFLPGTYVPLQSSDTPGVNTAAGTGVPIGYGDLPISWKDDDGKVHDFVLTEVLHIPSSPVNVLGLSAFSKIIGDYHTKGTRVDSSGSDSIFTWDNKKYRRSFTHSEANMPELPVNDGFFQISPIL